MNHMITGFNDDDSERLTHIEIREAQEIPLKGGRKKSTVYPFESMKVGESFVAGEYSKHLANKINSTIHYYSVKLGQKFCQRKAGNLLTVWRSE